MIQAPTFPSLDYSHGKQLAIQIFLNAMSALDLRTAMSAKLKREGEVLKLGEISFPLWKSRRQDGGRTG